jgi:peroxiredoxin
MNRIFQILSLCVLFSCKNIENKNIAVEDNSKTDDSQVNDKHLNEVFHTDPKALTQDFMTWYYYTNDNIRLSRDFIGLDPESVTIDKLTFLKKIMSDNQIPFKIKIQQGQPVYQLYTPGKIDETITTTIKQMAATELAHIKMEGTELPDFSFTDLNGNNYTKSSTKGKILILKCWFINCTACVKEFPELNKLVEEHRNFPDLLFVSLAIDSKHDLETFLKKKEFKYAVIPEMKNYMADKIGIAEYPTHLLINREGKIMKVVNRIEDLIPSLNRELSKI